jgi:hypothetical protein
LPCTQNNLNQYTNGAGPRPERGFCRAIGGGEKVAPDARLGSPREFAWAVAAHLPELSIPARCVPDAVL